MCIVLLQTCAYGLDELCCGICGYWPNEVVSPVSPAKVSIADVRLGCSGYKCDGHASCFDNPGSLPECYSLRGGYGQSSADVEVGV